MELSQIRTTITTPSAENVTKKIPNKLFPSTINK